MKRVSAHFFFLHENSPFFVPTTSKYLSSFKKIKKHTQTFTHKHTLSLVHHVVGRLKCKNRLEIVLSWMVNPLEREKNVLRKISYVEIFISLKQFPFFKEWE